MKIKEGYLLDMIGEQNVAVALERSADKFSGIVKLNSAGAFLWEQMQEETDVQKLVAALMEKYDVDSSTAEQDVLKFIDMLDAKKILEK